VITKAEILVQEEATGIFIEAALCTKMCSTTPLPTQPNPMEDKVIPNCVAAKYRSKCWVICIANPATLLPDFALSSNCETLILTIANSAATKNPLAATSNKIQKRSQPING